MVWPQPGFNTPQMWQLSKMFSGLNDGLWCHFDDPCQWDVSWILIRFLKKLSYIRLCISIFVISLMSFFHIAIPLRLLFQSIMCPIQWCVIILSLQPRLVSLLLLAIHTTSCVDELYNTLWWITFIPCPPHWDCDEPQHIDRLANDHYVNSWSTTTNVIQHDSPLLRCRDSPWFDSTQCNSMWHYAMQYDLMEWNSIRYR